MHFNRLLETDSIFAFLFKIFDSINEILSLLGWAGIFIDSEECFPNYITLMAIHFICVPNVYAHTHACTYTQYSAKYFAIYYSYYSYVHADTLFFPYQLLVIPPPSFHNTHQGDPL